MTLGSATRGQGGIPPTGRSDLEALMGRLGRKETCIVNAAIMASSYPYTGAGGERYNKPIVVDLELPVWNGGVYAKDVMDWQQEAGPEAASRKQRGTSFAESVQWSETRSGQ